MRRSTSFRLFSSTALTATLLLATPALAQQDQAAPPPDPAATAQQDPATPAQNPDTPETTVTQAGGTDQIVVTGQRRALQSARNVKRNSDQIVDAIVAQDIGKLPDIAVSDTAARIPGIQVTRERGEADRVLLRGLDRNFYTTTYNGREIFTAETRSVALQDFPSGAIAALEAFKTSTANLIEPGIAGLVNVRSRRPFDFKGFEINGSVWELHPRQSGDWNLNGNLLITNRWRVGDGEMGALLNFSYTTLHYLDSVIENAYFVAPLNIDASGNPVGPPFPADTQFLRLPDWPRIEYDEALRKRPSINGAIQWRPNPDLEFYAEGLWQGFRHHIQDRHFEVPIWGGQQYTNIVTRPGNLVESGTVLNPHRGEGWQGATLNRTNTYQFAVGGRWDHGPLRISADVARTSSKFTGSTESVDYVLSPENGNGQGNYTVDFVIGGPYDIPSFTVRNFDPSNPNNYRFRGLFEQNQVAKGDDWQGRLDFEYQTGIEALPRLQWGVRYVDRDASRQYGDRYNSSRYGTPLSAVPLDYELFRPGFRGANDKPFPLTWLAPTYSSVRDNIDELRLFAGFPSSDKAPFDPAAAFKANEKSLAGYAQLNYEFGPVDGQLGVRAVHVDRDISGTQRTSTGDRPIDVTQKETFFLPNINARAKITDNLQLRGALTWTRTRPQFQDDRDPILNPSMTFDQLPGCYVPGQPIPPGVLCEITARGGNPFLKDLTSTNWDTSLEYYFSRTGFASIAGFHHRLKGFVTRSSYQFPTNDPTTGLPIRVIAPINSGKGHVSGFEAQANTFFDFLGGPQWLSWFGVQANATYVNGKADYPNFGDTSDMIQRPLLNVSKWTYNVIGMFERGPASVRLAYNKRSNYWAAYDERNDFSSNGQNYVLRQKVREPGRLDLSASYTFFDRFTLFGDWTNILSKPQRWNVVRIDPSGPRFDPNGNRVEFAWRGRYTERILSLGVRFRFGGGDGPAPVAAPAPMAPPPPPPAAVEQPAAPPPPPPPAPTTSGERGQ